MNSTYPLVLECNGEISPPSHNPPLKQAVKKALEDYFFHLEGHFPVNLYKLVLKEIEVPLLEVVMELTKHNQSKAANLLGLSRATLRKKLKDYQLEHE